MNPDDIVFELDCAEELLRLVVAAVKSDLLSDVKSGEALQAAGKAAFAGKLEAAIAALNNAREFVDRMVAEASVQ